MVGARNFAVMCDTMQHLLDELNPDDSAGLIHSDLAAVELAGI